MEKYVKSMIDNGADPDIKINYYNKNVSVIANLYRGGL